MVVILGIIGEVPDYPAIFLKPTARQCWSNSKGAAG